MRRLIASLTFLYPVVLFGFRNSPYFYPIALGLGGLLILELITRLPGKWLLASLSGIALLAALMHVFGVRNEVRLYPFLMSFSMLLLFSLSKDPNENPMLGPFRQKVSTRPGLLRALHEAKIIWIVGLTINSGILFSFLFAFPQETWVIYASFYSYLFLVLLFLVSIVFVHFRKRKWA